MSTSTPSRQPNSQSNHQSSTDNPQINTDPIENSLNRVIQTLFELSVFTYNNDSGSSLQDGLQPNIIRLLRNFEELQDEAEKVKDISIPREVIGYVEHGRNPDIYTREFVELAIKQNQYLNGKQRAFQDFRDVLAEQIKTTFPELKEDVDEVVENTGGKRDANGMLTLTSGIADSPSDSTGPPSSIPVNGVMRMSISGNNGDGSTPIS